MKRTFLSLFFLALITGCGGPLSLVSTEPQAAPAPAPVLPAIRVRETFLNGKPSGTLLVPIVLFSSKTMENTATALIQNRDVWASEFCREDRGFQTVVFVVSLDSALGGAATHVETGAGEACRNSLNAFFAKAFEKIRQEVRNDWDGRLYPFDAMADVLGAVSVDSYPPGLPAWVHSIYFRDRELLGRGASESAGLDRLLQSVSRSPLSPFRHTLSSVSYIEVQSRCRPPASRLAPALRKYLSEVRGDTYELCDLPRESLRRFARQALELSGKIVLGRAAKPESLEVSLAGVVLRRERFEWDAQNNVLGLRLLSAAQPADPVEVTYELK